MTEPELRTRYVRGLEEYLGTAEGDERHQELMGLYNSLPVLPRGYRMTLTADWCVAFPVALAVKQGLTDIIYPECSCTRAVALYQAAGRFVKDRNYVPLPGDFLVYDWQDNADPDHWGTVVSISGSRLKVIEGNLDNRAAYRELEMGDGRIYGYCLPDYAGRAETETFRDVAADAWYAPDVAYSAAHGLMLGKGDGIFDPEAPVTRAELATVAARLHRLLQ